MKRLVFCCLCLLDAALGAAYTRQDTLRGSNGRGRDWWDVVRYDLTMQIDTAKKNITGKNRITFRVGQKPRDSIQIDLQRGIEITSADLYDVDGKYFNSDLSHDNDIWWVVITDSGMVAGKEYNLDIEFKGIPRIARNPPWDGGFIWTKDSAGNPWIAVACQGLGASSWWPCKDCQGDEPDSGMFFCINEPKNNVGNGRRASLISIPFEGRKQTDYLAWNVRNPINTYNTTFYIGDYAHWHDTLHGEKGVLDLDFYPLTYNEAKARKQWTQTKEMLHCFEYWMGPYPFYEDGYKLVEAPYLGMEHQSAIAYGNHYTNGYYRPTGPIDRSATGVGFAFDFIIIHESGHEWFGNSITARDIADNWLHEGFTTYTEELFAEWIKGRDSGFAYTTGEWKNIKNDKPVIGDYGVNNEGSGDMYDKGSAVVHMIRMMINDDKKFRELLRGLNRDFYHKIVSSKDVEDYISRFVGRDLKVFFDVYLRSTVKPVLEWEKKNKRIVLSWKNFPKGFNAPVLVRRPSGDTIIIIEPLQLPGRVCGIVTGIDFVIPIKKRDSIFIIPCGWYDVVEKKDIK